MQKNGNLEISVADPTQANTGTIHVTLGQSALSTIDNSPNVTVSSLSPIEIAVNVSGLLGQPASARFNLSTGGLVVVDNATTTGGSTVSSTGTWTASTGTVGYYGTNYAEDGNTKQR
jgi:hyaluronate lyase